MKHILAVLNRAQRDRLRTEKAEIDVRRKTLQTFVDAPEFTGLPWEQRTLLSDQLGIMDEYSAVLGQRIDMEKQV